MEFVAYRTIEKNFRMISYKANSVMDFPLKMNGAEKKKSQERDRDRLSVSLKP